MNGPAAKFNNFFFSEQLSMSYIRGIWFPNREHSKVVKAVFVLCLHATHSCIFVSNAKLVRRRRPCPNYLINCTMLKKKSIEHIFVF